MDTDIVRKAPSRMFRYEPLDAPELSAWKDLQTAIWITDADKRRIVWANEAALEIWRADSREELVNRPLRMSDTAEQTFIHLHERVMAGEKIRSLRTLYPKGQPTLIEMLIGRYTLPDDRVGFLVEARPVAQDAIDPSVLRNADAARYAPICMAIHTLNGAILTANALTHKIFGDVRSLRDYFCDDADEQRVLDGLNKAEGFVSDFEVLTRRGPAIYSLQAKLLPDPVTGEQIIIVSLQDPSVRLENERLSILNHSLTRSNEELSQFASAASHDLKTPLVAIETHVHFAVESLQANDLEDCGVQLEMVRKRAKRMRWLLDEFLNYARDVQEMGALSEVDVHQLLHDLLEWASFPESGELRLEIELPFLKTYLTPLKKVLLNLINNAVKHHNNSDNIVLAIRLWEEHGFVVFSVTDNGPGIDKVQHQRIFEMFKTLYPSDEARGAGVGLAIARRIVELHGGEISVRSHKGLGSTFQFTWPKEEGTSSYNGTNLAARPWG